MIQAGRRRGVWRGRTLQSVPGDNRQRGRLLPADRPNYSRKYRLASENEIGPLFARRTAKACTS